MEILIYPGLVAFIALVVWLMVRNFRVISPDYRQKQYYKMSNEEINQLTSTPTECKFTFGQSGPGLDEPATIVCGKDFIHVTTTKGESEKLFLKDVKKVESPDPATLYVFPTWTKTFAILNDGRWGVFFGKSLTERGYGELPFKWQPKAKEAWQADKIAVAYYLRIKRSIAR